MKKVWLLIKIKNGEIIDIKAYNKYEDAKRFKQDDYEIHVVNVY